MITNEEYIQEYIHTRGLKKTTYNITKVILNHYSKFQQTTLHELIIEADNEEEQGIRWKNRKLKTRLVNYMTHLRETMKYSSAKTYLRTIKAFYFHHEIEVHRLPKWNPKNAQLTEPLTYNDLPDRQIIKSAVEIAEPLMKALLLFLSSSGMSKVDALSLTINDFIESTFRYHQKMDQVTAIQTLFNMTDIDMIPSFKCRRNKTGKYFITFCTHEATREILNYLYIRMEKGMVLGKNIIKVN